MPAIALFCQSKKWCDFEDRASRKLLIGWPLLASAPQVLTILNTRVLSLPPIQTRSVQGKRRGLSTAPSLRLPPSASTTRRDADSGWRRGSSDSLSVQAPKPIRTLDRTRENQVTHSKTLELHRLALGNVGEAPAASKQIIPCLHARSKDARPSFATYLRTLDRT